MIKKIAILIILVAAVAVGLEVYLNLSHYNTEILYQYQPAFGWSHSANKNFWYHENLFTINQDGFRDVNHPKEKSNDVIRVAFAGSHYLEGMNSSFDNIATTILEKQWNQKNEKKIEVFNFTTPKNNLEMVYFLIKYFSQKYDIDYFFYFFDPQKDPMIVAGSSDVTKHSPLLIFDDNGQVQEKTDFSIPPFVSPEYKTLKSYQFVRDLYYNFKNSLAGKKTSLNLEEDPNLFKPYPEIYFDQISTSTDQVVEKIAKIVDYIIDNSQSKVYIIMSPPQHTQFFEYYEKAGNLAYFSQNNDFVNFVKKTHNLDFNVFMTETMFFIKQVDGNHFNPQNLTLRLQNKMENKDHLIDITDNFLPFAETPQADGFFQNWHRRDSGQAYLAKVLEENVLPQLLSNQ